MDIKLSLKVAVIMGGPSGEHEISLKSGQGITHALTRQGWSAQAVVIPKELSVAQACSWARAQLPVLDVDVLFLALHGSFGEDGTIQEICEELHLAFTGSDASASRLGMDKASSKQRFASCGLRVPRGLKVDLSTEGSQLSLSVLRKLSSIPISFPVVVKPVDQGSSLGISLVSAEKDLSAALSAAGRFSKCLLIEEYITGRELTVGVLGDQVLPVIEVRPMHSFFDYTAKYTAGLTEYCIPASVTSEEATRAQQAAWSAHQALGCRHLSRTDMILNGKGELFVLEVNTIPGFTPTSLVPKACASIGISYESLCEQLVMMAWLGSGHLART
ncbi:MAG: D-alanine--D-alanine ligase [Candidatus Omnitrophica bacterium]|nr:D-alanine--D-alanine ligase [Candidatus Omnitrophota bacterium]